VIVNKRKRRLNKGTEARRLARKAAAKPATTRVVGDKRRKPQKHRESRVESMIATDA